jgi:hypothetical protein
MQESLSEENIPKMREDTAVENRDVSPPPMCITLHQCEHENIAISLDDKIILPECHALHLCHPDLGMHGPEVRFEAASHTYTFWEEARGEFVPANTSVTSFLSEFMEPFPDIAATRTRQAIERKFRAWFAKTTSPRPSPLTLSPSRDQWPEKYLVFVSRQMFREVDEAFPRSAAPYTIEKCLAVARMFKAQCRPLPRFIDDNSYDCFMTDEDVRTGWSREGTELHYSIEQYMNRRVCQCPFRAPCLEEVPEWKYVLQFFEDKDGEHEWVATEMRIAFPELSICGSFDALSRHRTTGEYWLWDWKRTKKIRTQDEQMDEDMENGKYMYFPLTSWPATSRYKFILQLNMYRAMLAQCYGIIVSRMHIVVFHPQLQTYLQINVPRIEDTLPAMRDGFVQALAMRESTFSSLAPQSPSPLVNE